MLEFLIGGDLEAVVVDSLRINQTEDMAHNSTLTSGIEALKDDEHPAGFRVAATASEEHLLQFS